MDSAGPKQTIDAITSAGIPLVSVPEATRWGWVAGICYSSGFGTRGVLTKEQLRAIGVTTKMRRQLVSAGLWIDLPTGSVEINDWDEHNAARDARRAVDRRRRRSRTEACWQPARWRRCGMRDA